MVFEYLRQSALILTSALHLEIWNDLVTNHSQQMIDAALLTNTNPLQEVNDHAYDLTQDIHHRILRITEILTAMNPDSAHPTSENNNQNLSPDPP